MILYHASDKIIEHPKYDYGNPYSDFGLSFYLTSDIEMAKKWACRKSPAYINIYNIDLSEYQTYKFTPSGEWIDFVVSNRKSGKIFVTSYFDPKPYDIIIGPTADDQIFSTVEQYAQGLMRRDLAIKILNCMTIGNQYAFKNQEVTDQLKFKSAKVLSRNEIFSAKSKVKEERIKKDRLTTKLIRESIMKENNAQNKGISNLDDGYELDEPEQDSMDLEPED